MSAGRQPPMIRVGRDPATPEDLQALADIDYDGPTPVTRADAHTALIAAKLARRAELEPPATVEELLEPDGSPRAPWQDLQDRPGGKGSDRARRLAGADEDPAGAAQSGPATPAPSSSARERVAALRARRGEIIAQPPTDPHGVVTDLDS